MQLGGSESDDDDDDDDDKTPVQQKQSKSTFSKLATPPPNGQSKLTRATSRKSLDKKPPASSTALESRNSMLNSMRGRSQGSTHWTKKLLSVRNVVLVCR